MIHPDLQPTLFNTPKEDVLKKNGTTESLATQWFNQGYLSFDISTCKDLTYSQELELTFISKIFGSILSLDAINRILSKLQKPYAYNFREIYFDLFENEWKYLPEEVEDEDDEEEEIDEEEVTDHYLSNLDPDSEREKIEQYIKFLNDLIN